MVAGIDDRDVQQMAMSMISNEIFLALTDYMRGVCNDFNPLVGRNMMYNMLQNMIRNIKLMRDVIINMKGDGDEFDNTLRDALDHALNKNRFLTLGTSSGKRPR